MRLSEIYPNINEQDYLMERGEYFVTKDKIGVEIELESMIDFSYKIDNTFKKYWTICEDNSLRDYGVEIKHKKGFWGADLEESFSVLKDALKRQENEEGEISTSDRTSIQIGRAHV